MLHTKRIAASVALAAAIALAAQPSVHAQASAPEGEPSIVVTTEVLGAVVREVVSDSADVVVLMGTGADPHTWQPSARDAERVLDATLLVENGLALEEGLLGIIERARDEGVPLFTATDHITLLTTDEHAEGEELDDEHGPEDPHFWLDPLAVRSVVEAMVPALEGIGVDAASGASAVIADLTALDAEIESILSGIEDDQRKLVTGHEALGYFADRYDFEVVGTVIPDDTTSGDASARDVATLIETIRDEGVSVVFTDAGTPRSVARTVAEDGGGELVELNVAQIAEDGSYRTLMLELAQTVAEAFGE